MRALIYVIAGIGIASSAQSQTVRGVTLGKSKLQQVIGIRGAPVTSGRTEDGSDVFLRYGEWSFYFGRDSIALYARFFPPQMRREEIERHFGRPLEEHRDHDFTISALYSDTAVVEYQADSNSVIYIQYNSRSPIIEGHAVRFEKIMSNVTLAYRNRLFAGVWDQCTRAAYRVTSAQAIATVNRMLHVRSDSVASHSVRDSLRVYNNAVCENVERKLYESMF